MELSEDSDKLSTTEAIHEPHSSRKNPDENEPNAASDIADADTTNSEPNVTHTDAERLRAAFSTPLSGDDEKNAFTQPKMS